MEGNPSNSQTRLRALEQPAPQGDGWVKRGDESYYRIAAIQQMKPFLMSVPTDTDLWMFITSGGGLTCGRVDADGCLFPYQTVDQLHDAHHHSGPITLIRVEDGPNPDTLWEPFSTEGRNNPDIERNLYKNVGGTRLVFEESHKNLGLTFSYRWAGCQEFGWGRTATLINHGNQARRLSLLDGLRNILPFGAPLALYQQSSTLVDAYRRADIDPETGLGIFSLTAGITDKAEAMEILQANTVWSCGLEQSRIHLSPQAVEDFRRNRVLPGETVQKGGRSNYLLSATLDLAPARQAQWHMAADTGLDHDQISQLRDLLQTSKNLSSKVELNLDQGRDNFAQLVAGADGLQYSAEPGTSAHHFANVMFNGMRGGIFLDNYNIPREDFQDFVLTRNKALASQVADILEGMPTKITADQLFSTMAEHADPNLERLCLEYLPLHFGRRHGDPSRPWNKFAINVRDEEGQQMLDYQGNWRDIFQNWEALGRSFPQFLPHFVAKFVNASTVDGFNPYRISRDGVDWEEENSEDPWSNIGYWGDHQIIYLLKLLESWGDHDPAGIRDMLGKKLFSYAQVPYRIRSFAEIVEDPANTITFDDVLHKSIMDRIPHQGTDGRLLPDTDGNIYHVTLFEKLLVPALAKLANFVPGAGIWMNTQRPEWNDANNALAGGGVSVVTLFYLRRYIQHLIALLDGCGDQPLPVSREIINWFEETARIISTMNLDALVGTQEAESRFKVMSALGQAYSQYRDKVYSGGFSGQDCLSTQWVSSVMGSALEMIDQTLELNHRADGLYHTYNLLDLDPSAERANIRRLPVMLEGQVAALSSGIVAPETAVELLDQLFESPLYREDQNSFVLYPVVELPSFLEKNQVAKEQIAEIPLLEKLLAADHKRLVLCDAQGVHRFSGRLRQVDDVSAALDQLAEDPRWTADVQNDRQATIELFEATFSHDSYTGRSGYMYGYEGIGCIYWHMVAKLLLAVQEVWQESADKEQDHKTTAALARNYRRIREGLGFRKSARQYGAFPSDPYSHTPADGGARQPGMTGQVKEEILTRCGELGLQVQKGCLSFKPRLLEMVEFGSSPTTFPHHDVQGNRADLPLSPGTMAFTCCQVPVVYEKVTGSPWIRITYGDGSQKTLTGHELDAETSSEIFARSGQVDRIRVGIPRDQLR